MKKLLFIMFVCCAIIDAQAQTVASLATPKSVVSPEINPNGISFRIYAPDAKTVNLYGSWMADNTFTTLTKETSGIWSAIVPLPEPDLYTYNFIVDGVPTSDGNNIMMVRDAIRYQSALIVPGKQTENYFEAKQRGNISKVWYDSPTIGENRRMYVYTPYGYEKSSARYPVLYLLHPGGRDEEGWPIMGRTCQILDNLIEKKLAVPMIIVMPNTNAEQQAAKPLLISERKVDVNDPVFANSFLHSIVKDIIPYVEANYRVIAKPESRAIAGSSRGGRITMNVTSEYPGTFSYICPLSMGLRPEDMNGVDDRFQAVKKGGYKLYWIGCGKSDQLFENVNILDKVLTKNGLEHTYCITPGAHTWSVWRTYLNTFAPLLFK